MSLEEIREIKLKKLRKIDKIFGSTFPVGIAPDYSLEEVLSNFSKLSKRRMPLRLVGRVFGIRKHGGVIFCDFKYEAVSFQAYIKKEIVGEDLFLFFEEVVDVGDFLEFKGNFFKTQKGEKSIKVSSFRVLVKSLRPLPEKWHGLSDTEERFRKRYLDLLMNDDARNVFVLRSRIITQIRDFLNKNDFLEVETPVLQSLAGGALAEPFKTHHNALNIDLFLRIAPELYLKRLLVGGFNKVYELGRNFRNEGIDTTHNPEFTMLEFYQAYCDTDFMKNFVEDLFKNLMKKVFNKKIEKFSTISFYEVLKRHALINDVENISQEDLKLKAQQFGLEVADSDSKDKIADNIFKKVCRPKLIQPVFVVDYPIGLYPLTKAKEENKNLADAFQLFINGLELVKAYSELNNPLEQKERFEKQQELRKAGDKEALEFDRDYIEAMEYGMPPAVGVGIGIERLIMYLLNISNIKETILFPTMRPKE